eukprot:TRINITY_DN19987_c0_g1_i1.p1 TRINITY_DN19987_c0_g1~~TRINITY_DN19987_c0_g1_i1.p1  ORF type:complete len:478 (+),score=56.86 TRINITY_DN19987_c0_g1_i1:25-1434(+)
MCIRDSMMALHGSRLFVMGGRQNCQEKDGLLASTEVLDLSDGSFQWKQGPSLVKSRSSGCAVIFKQQLHIFGGYTSPHLRSRKIERLNEKDAVWESLDIKLPLGLEAALILPHPGVPSNFLLLGGYDNGGAVSHVFTLNFSTGTVKRLPNMLEARFLAKGAIFDQKIYVFGGEMSVPVECAHIADFKWEEASTSFENILPDLHLLQNFCQAQRTIVLEDIPNEEQPPTVRYSTTSLFFGTDSNPRILEFNMDEATITNLPIPLHGKLLSYQTGARLSNDKFFLAGGLSIRSPVLVSRYAWLYNRSKGTAKVLPKLRIPRFACSCVATGGFVYVIGGRTYGDDFNSVLTDCERFDLANGKWQQLPPMNLPRVSAAVFVIKDKIFMAGGFVGAQHGRTETIEVLNLVEWRWKLLGLRLPEPLEAPASFVLEGENSVLILGGKTGAGETSAVWKLCFSDRMDSAWVLSLIHI